jgi:EAL domain-containing protein (putative c-di-GMP-specific phosphodiesterase class I)
MIRLDTAELVKAIIALAHSLTLKVVAEEVETEEHFRMLSEQGCNEFQVFLYSPAIPASDMTWLLIEQNIFLNNRQTRLKLLEMPTKPWNA